METIYQDIAARTGGNIYIGVVGPVRTGKSTLIKRIMEELVIPAMEDPFRAERARDELPQCGSGRTIMTAEPKFVPEEAVEVSPDGTARLRIRMIDSVGYMIPGAMGAEEDGKPRMVTTPWFDREIPMTQAAELGTKKVMEGHATLGLVVTTDGTVTDIPREDYVQAEKRAIADMRATGKPYLVVNKWDLIEKDGKTMDRMREDIRRDLSYMPYAPILFISALTGQRVGRLFELINYVNDQAAMRITTGTLNSVLADAQTRVQPPTDKGRRLKIYYMTQVGVKPPHFVIFCNDKKLFHFSYQRYLENQLRSVFGLEGTPIVLTIRQKGEDEN